MDLKEAAKEYQPNEGNTCIECGKQLKTKTSRRCRNCWNLFTKHGENLKLMVGSKNVNWQGNDVGYRSLHHWVRRHKPMVDFCSSCGKKSKVQAANISGEYKRDINDYEWLCPRCHVYKDGTVNNLKSQQEVHKNGSK